MNNIPDLSGQNILITGGFGFIGSNLAIKCVESGANVTIYDCLDQHSGGNIFNIEPIKNDVKIILSDIRNFEGISASIINQNILFSCAAFTSHPNSMKEPLIDIDVNCKGIINILEASRRFNPDMKIVHVGTSTQIGKMHYNPVTENHCEFPLDIYSANKSVSEKYILVYANSYNMRATVIRLANNFGPRSNIKNPDFGFMNYFIGLGLKDKEITLFGEGSQLRNISYIEDSVSSLILASQSEKSNGDVFFAVSDEQYSILQIAEAIQKYIGGTLKCVEWPKERETIEIGDAVISNKKIKETLNWSPQYDLATGLIKTREYFSNCLKKYL